MLLVVGLSICVVITLSSPVEQNSQSSHICKNMPIGTLVPDQFNCSRFNLCVYGSPVLMSCPAGTWFDSNIKECKAIGNFCPGEEAKCYDGSEQNARKAVIICYVSKEKANVTWIHDSNSTTSMNSLPENITLDLPLGNDSVKLDLIIRPHFTQDIKVICTLQGKHEDWKPDQSEEWSVYSDPISHASMSVSTKMVNGSKIVQYGGSFISNDTRYQIRIDSVSKGYPVDHKTATLVTINGTDYLVSQDHNDSTTIDEEGREINSSEAQSVMSSLERLVMQREEQGYSGKKNYGIELFISIDYSIYYKWLVQSLATDEMSKSAEAIANIRYFYTHIANRINDAYMGINDDSGSFYVRVVGMYIAKSPHDSPFTELQTIKINGEHAIDVYNALDEYERWIANEANKPDRTLPTFDSAALFTDYRMKVKKVDGSHYFISGLGNIGATCTIRGVSISTDHSMFNTVRTAAHEIGHTLGSYHDGDENPCSRGQQFIMASAPGGLSDETFFNPYKFSDCSIKYFKDYIIKLDGTNNNCLLNAAVNEDGSFDDKMRSYPGQKYDINLQCRLMFGTTSYHCAGGGERDKLICKSLSCWDPMLNQCSFNLVALDGTPCGNGAWCIRSTCTSDSRAPQQSSTCIYGDFKAPFTLENKDINCEWMVQNRPYRCYEEYFNALCCASCAAKADHNFIHCEWGDKLMDYCPTMPQSTCYESYYRERCCAKCRQFEINVDIPNCRYGNKAGWCNGIQKTSCYSVEDTCCQTCSSFRTNLKGCEYGEINTQCTEEHCLSQTKWQDCCITCQEYITGKITTSTTSTTTTTTKIPLFANCPKGDGAPWCPPISPADCYGANVTCCETCMHYYKPQNIGCEYGDWADWCKTYVSKADDCQNPHTMQQCCISCQPYKTPNFVVPTCPNGDESDYCKTMKPYECYNFKNTCCGTCSKQYDANSKNCEYGDKASWCALYVKGPVECEKPEVVELCCGSCKSLINEKLDLTNLCRDEQSYCKSMFQGFCYDAFNANNCCSSCAKMKRKDSNCLYGDKYSWCAKEFCSMNSADCCETCV